MPYVEQLRIQQYCCNLKKKEQKLGKREREDAAEAGTSQFEPALFSSDGESRGGMGEGKAFTGSKKGICVPKLLASEYFTIKSILE